MKFKLLIALSFMASLAVAQPSKIEPPVTPKAPSTGILGANGDGVKPAIPVAVNPPAKSVTSQNHNARPEVIITIVSNPGTKPAQHVGGANTQPSDGRNLQSSSQSQQQTEGIKNQPNNLLSSGQKPVAINPPARPAIARNEGTIATKNTYSTGGIGQSPGGIFGEHAGKPALTPQKQMVGASASSGPVASPDDGPKIEEID